MVSTNANLAYYVTAHDIDVRPLAQSRGPPNHIKESSYTTGTQPLEVYVACVKIFEQELGGAMGTSLLRSTVVEPDRAIGRLVTSSHPSSSLIGCVLLALGMAFQECLGRGDWLGTCYSHFRDT